MKRFNLKWLVQGWFVRPDVGALESFLMRLLFALIVAFALRFPVTFTIEPHPVGILRILHWLFDAPGITDHSHCRTWLTWLADEGTFDVYRKVIYALLAVYVAGYGFPLVMPVLTVMHILPFTLFDSQGYPHHGNQIISLLLMVQTGCVLCHAVRERKLELAPPGPVLRGWLLWQSVTLVAGTYFLSVITKLEQSKGMWLWNSNNFALDMIKTQRQSWLNKLSPEFANIPDSALWMLQHPWAARAVFSSGLILEVLCIFAIGNRLIGLVIGLSFLVMHRSIDALMGGVAFPYNELLDMVFFVGVPYGLAWTLEKLLPKSLAWGAVLGALAGVPLSWLAVTPSDHIPNLGTYLQWVVNYLGVWDNQKWGDLLNFIWPQMIVTCLVTAGIGIAAAQWLSRRTEGTPAAA